MNSCKEGEMTYRGYIYTQKKISLACSPNSVGIMLSEEVNTQTQTEKEKQRVT